MDRSSALFNATQCRSTFAADLETKIDFSDSSVIKEASIHIIDCYESFDDEGFDEDNFEEDDF